MSETVRRKGSGDLLRSETAGATAGVIPLMETSGFSDIEIAQARFRVLGLSILGFVRGSARKC